jgi:NYN domain
VGIYLGHYLSHEISMPLANPPPSGPRFVKVIKTEEKGSDVNLATHLLSDAYENRFDVAVIVSNDSDLLAPMNVVTQRLRKKVGILNPHRKPAVVLKRAATFYKPIREGVLRDSQFPATLTDAQGIFHKPARW